MLFFIIVLILLYKNTWRDECAFGTGFGLIIEVLLEMGFLRDMVVGI